MNAFGKSIMRKFACLFGANFAGLMVSVFSVSFIPKYMSIEDYGLYQLFLFYFGYVGFLHFGVLGGAIIRYAGCRYSQLDYGSLKTQCVILFLLLCFLSMGLALWALSVDLFDKTILGLFFLSMFAQHIIWYSVSMLQMSNRIEEASKLTLWERVSWGIFGVGAVLCGYTEAVYVILAYAVTRILAMIYSLTFVSEIVWAPVRFQSGVWKEFKVNFALGCPVTLSDICAILILGIIRFGISDVWDISVFAKTSLALGFTFFFLTFVSSASIVLLPALRQIETKTGEDLYLALNKLFSVLLLFVLLGYFPLRALIMFWLPKYADGLTFMGILFPVLFFDSKFNLLISTYLKKILKTRAIFYINLVSAVVSWGGCILFCYHLQNIILSIALITAVLGLRYTLAEYVLGRYMHFLRKLAMEWAQTMIAVCLFVCIATWGHELWAGLEYSGVLVIYVCLGWRQIKQSWLQVKQIVTA